MLLDVSLFLDYFILILSTQRNVELPGGTAILITFYPLEIKPSKKRENIRKRENRKEITKDPGWPASPQK